MTVALVPESIAGIFEWDDYPVLCTGPGDRKCGNDATWMIRVEKHGCKHDGRFYFKCDECMEPIIERGHAICSLKNLAARVVEAREFRR